VKPEEVYELQKRLYSEFCQKNNYEEESEEAIKEFRKLLSPIKIHDGKAHYSKLLIDTNTKEIARLFQVSEEQALEQEIKKIEQEINQPLTDELKKLISDFIQTSKITIKDKGNEVAEDKV
jgi:hypothetical protein